MLPILAVCGKGGVGEIIEGGGLRNGDGDRGAFLLCLR